MHSNIFVVPNPRRSPVKQIRKRITYANVMSSIAVFLVLGGASAYAAKKIGSNEIKGNSITTGKIKKEAVATAKIKKEAVKTSKIANNAVASAKLADNAVITAKIANDAVTGEKVKESSLSEVPKAALAVSAESAQPQAFGAVNSSGIVDSAISKGLSTANVTHPKTGVFCVTAAQFTARGGQATPIFGGTDGTTANLTVGGTSDCPAPSVQVQTFTTGAAPAPADIGFNVVLYH
jgi:hypothetical protein